MSMYSWSNLLGDKLTQWLMHARQARGAGYMGEMRKTPVNRLIVSLRLMFENLAGRSVNWSRAPNCGRTTRRLQPAAGGAWRLRRGWRCGHGQPNRGLDRRDRAAHLVSVRRDSKTDS